MFRLRKHLLLISILFTFFLTGLVYSIQLLILGDPVAVMQANEQARPWMLVWRIFLYTALTLFYLHILRLHKAKGATEGIKDLNRIRNFGIATAVLVEVGNLMKGVI